MSRVTLAALIVLVTILGIGRGFAAVPASQPSRPVPAGEQALLHDGRAIHPMVLKELLPQPDNAESGCIAVDLARANSSKRYVQKVKVLANGTIFCFLDDADEGGGYVQYRHLGTLQNGTHVAQFAWSGGGSGVFGSLLFLRLQRQAIRGVDGLQHDRPVLELLESFPLGDHYQGRIMLAGDRVVLERSPNRDAPLTLAQPQILREDAGLAAPATGTGQ